ncbi:MAG: DUF4149 domain-containing protein [Epsilonproteobacteria bacterium]|nr:DUF4149 domain-containing protein [Campylobacterota bacterium]
MNGLGKDTCIPKHLWIIYLTLLGVTLGVAVCVGVFAAPVIFHADDLLGGGVLNHYQEGVIMTEIFVRSNYLITFTSIAVLLVEAYHFFVFCRDKITFFSAFAVVWMGLMFTLYYTPQIIEFQQMGESILKNELFQKTHFASELDYKLFVLSLAVLFVRYLYRKIER